MRNVLITTLAFCVATTLVVSAQETISGTPATNTAPARVPTGKPTKRELTAEQIALRKELLEKYDSNKNGKLDKEEFALISKSKDDREKAVKARLILYQSNLQKMSK